MDAITEFTQEMVGNDVQKFMLTGESKVSTILQPYDHVMAVFMLWGNLNQLFNILQRGWTTWLHGAIDDRVVAMAPVVLSILNTQEVKQPASFLITMFLTSANDSCNSNLSGSFYHFLSEHFHRTLGTAQEIRQKKASLICISSP